MNCIRAELFFLFQKKIKAYILILIITILCLIIQKEIVYRNIRESRMEEYQAKTELIQSNINFLAFEKETDQMTNDQEELLSFWEHAYDLNYQV